MSELGGRGHRLSRAISLLRYHRPSQFAWRLWSIARRATRRRLPERWVFEAKGRAANWKPGARESFRCIALHRQRLWPARTRHVSGIAEGRFRFLNQERFLSSDEQPLAIDWNPDAPRLWRFHLQCHEYLPDVAETSGAEAAYGLIQSWLNESRHRSPCIDPDAWHPFCISRRLPAWLSLLSLHYPPDNWSDRIWSSLADQVSWLSQNCEWDLGGNHLLENLAALYLASSFLDVEPRCQLGFVESRLTNELSEQILPSGEHFERAPTYHALMMVCLAECCAAAEFSGSDRFDDFVVTLDRMSQLADWIRQPNGDLPLLGDSARDETPDLDRLSLWTKSFHCANQTKTPVDTDYWITGNEQGDQLLFDTGPLACNHLPAHGHADLTQITASLRGHEAIVDTGNYDYEPSEIRQHCRGTGAHNVMQYGEQCDIWSAFRMGRRGRPVSSRRGTSHGWEWKSVCHNAYPELAGRVVLSNENAWIVIDWHDIKANANGQIHSHLHWHPDWQLVVEDDERRIAAMPQWETAPYCIDAIECTATIEPGIYCPNFGERIENLRVKFSQTCLAHAAFGFQVSLNPGRRIEPPQIERVESRLSVHFPGGETVPCSLH
ncbi:MAG: alginate lyase family protein [Planctomycetota bacterium]